MHDAFTALGGMIPLINIQLGEIIVGGVGAGLYGMLIFVIIAIFVAGLMVGRTPEYVGKKIEAREVKMAMLAILILPLMYLGLTAVAVVLPSAVASTANAGPHGFSEILYAYTSQTGNNGSAFAGLTGNTFFYNTTGGLAMLVGRFFMIVPAMAIAGALAAKKSVPASVGHLPDHRRPVRWAAGRRRPDHRRAHLLPRAGARPDRRAPRHARRHPVLTAPGARPCKPLPMRKAPASPRWPIPRSSGPALGSAFAKLDPRLMIKNPVMFVVEVVAALTTVLFIRDLVTGSANLGFTFQIILWLWITVLFANFSEAVAEGRGKAQADSLRRTRSETQAKRLKDESSRDYELVPGQTLRVGDIVLVEAGDIIPSDGEVIEGIASVNEAAITGESAPVIRESGGDRSAVTGGTQVLSDWIRVRITAAQGSTFLDRMISLVEGAERQKTPNEIALEHPARRHDDHLRVRDGDHPELCRLRGRHGVRRRAGRAVRHAHPDDHRRAACRHRHRRHGSVWCASTCWPCPDAPSKPPATSIRCCSIRPAPSRSATGRRPPSCPCAASPSRIWPMRRSLPRSPTRRPRAAPSSCLPRRSTASAPVTSPSSTRDSCRSRRRPASAASSSPAARS